MTLVIAPPLQPWPEYLRDLADAAFVGEPAAPVDADSVRKRGLSAAAANAVADLDRAADLRVARLRTEALEAELDLARQTIALLSQRPSHQAYEALQQERDALRVQVPAVVAQAKPGIPSRALRFSA